MKLTPTEYKLLDALDSTTDGVLFIAYLKPATKRLAKQMVSHALLSRRAWFRGEVVATALGKRSHSYGKR